MIDAEGKKEFIPLDPEVKLADVIINMYIPLHPDWGQGPPREDLHKVHFFYGKKF